MNPNHPSKRLGYKPSVKICFVTRGSISGGRQSRALIWESHNIFQIRRDGADGWFYGADTIPSDNPLISQNALIYSKSHILENQDYYKNQIRIALNGYFSSLPEEVKRKRLRHPLHTIVQEFDSCNHRPLLHTFSNPLGWTETDVSAIFQAAFVKQDVIIDI